MPIRIVPDGRADLVKAEGESLRSLRGRLFEDNLDPLNKAQERLFEINFEMLRRMAHKDVLIAGIIKKRIDQLKPFFKVSRDNDIRGFRVVNKKGEVDRKAEEYQEFFLYSGYGDPTENDREDDFIDVNDKIIRDLLTIDQIAMECRYTTRGNLYDFWVLDGATVKRTKNNSEYKYVQSVKKYGTMKEEVKFRPEELIFDYMNKRSDIKHFGYGYAPLEQAIDTVTTFLFGMNYNRDMFVRDKIPKGFIKMMGDVNPQTVMQVQRYWYQQMTGYGARFKVPVIPSGKDGVGMDFVKLDSNPRDLEYDKLMNLVMSLQALPFGIDLMELGLKLDKTQQVIGESGEPRLQHSKDSGLSSILIFLESLWNKVQKKLDPDYEFEFVGIKDDDREKKIKLAKDQIESYRSIDEIREEEGLEPYNEEWSQMPLHPQAITLKNAADQAAQMQGMGGGFDDDEGGDEFGDEGDGGDDEGGFSVDAEDMELEFEGDGGEETEKSLRKSKPTKVVVI